jgi:hypothetical protein
MVSRVLVRFDGMSIDRQNLTVTLPAGCCLSNQYSQSSTEFSCGGLFMDYTLSINSRIASKSIGKWGDLVHCGFAKYVYPDHSTTFILGKKHLQL